MGQELPQPELDFCSKLLNSLIEINKTLKTHYSKKRDLKVLKKLFKPNATLSGGAAHPIETMSSLCTEKWQNFFKNQLLADSSKPRYVHELTITYRVVDDKSGETIFSDAQKQKVSNSKPVYKDFYQNVINLANNS